MMFHSSSFQHGTNCQILVTSVDVRCNLAPTHITKRGTKQQICVQYFCAAPQIQSPQLVILIAASGVSKPRLGPPGCIHNCCGVVVWSGQQQHAGPCITLSSFFEIPNGSRVRVWDAAAAAGLLHSYSLRSSRTFQTTSLTHLPPLPLYLLYRAGNEPEWL